MTCPSLLAAQIHEWLGQFYEADDLARAAAKRHARNPVIFVEANRVRGRALAAVGDFEGAQVALEDAAAEARRTRLFFLEAHALRDLANSVLSSKGAEDKQRGVEQYVAVVEGLASDAREIRPLLGDVGHFGPAAPGKG